MSPYICPIDLNARLSLSILGGGILRSVDLVSRHVAYSGQMLAVHWTQHVLHAALHPNHNHIRGRYLLFFSFFFARRKVLRPGGLCI